MSGLIRLFPLFPLVIVGCASTVPRAASIGEVRDTPSEYRNALVEVHGHVIEYREPKGDIARTWGFALRDRDGRVIRVYTDRRNADDIALADRLIAQAADDNGLVFLTGYIRTGKYDSSSGAARLDLRKVAYEEEVVKLRLRRTHDPYGPGTSFSIGIGYGHHYPHYHPHYPYRY